MELDVLQIVNTIHKLKAGVAAIVEDDEQIVRKAQAIYLKNTCIDVCGNEHSDDEDDGHDHPTYTHN
jgi:hypothetical protein